MTTYILQLEMAWKQEGESDVGNFLSYKDELKSSLTMADSKIVDQGRGGSFLCEMKRVLYMADGERFREKVFIGRIIAKYGTVVSLRHTVLYKD